MNTRLIRAGAFVLLLMVALLCFGLDYVSDGFNRADGALGANWTDWTGNNKIAISSNQVHATQAWASNGFAFWTGSSFTADHWAQVKTTILAQYDYIGLFIRAAQNSSSFNGYGFRCTNAGCVMVTWTAGSASWLGSATGYPANGNTLKFDVQGNSLNAYVNGSLVSGPVTDSTYSSGTTGFYLDRGNGGADVVADDFLADCTPTCASAAPATRHRIWISSLTWDFIPRAYAQSSFPRLYLMPAVVNASGGREPKYLSLLGNNATGMKFGGESMYLIAANVGSATDALLTANTDVKALPACIDTACSALDANLTSGAVSVVSAYLEAHKIPAEWVTTSLTYRQVLRIVAQMFQFAQRYQAVSNNAALFPSGITLESRINQLDAITKTNWQNTANSMNFSFSGVTGTTSIRSALKTLAVQWGTKPIRLGEITL